MQRDTFTPLEWAHWIFNGICDARDPSREVHINAFKDSSWSRCGGDLAGFLIGEYQRLKHNDLRSNFANGAANAIVLCTKQNRPIDVQALLEVTNILSPSDLVPSPTDSRIQLLEYLEQHLEHAGMLTHDMGVTSKWVALLAHLGPSSATNAAIKRVLGRPFQIDGVIWAALTALVSEEKLNLHQGNTWAEVVHPYISLIKNPSFKENRAAQLTFRSIFKMLGATFFVWGMARIIAFPPSEQKTENLLLYFTHDFDLDCDADGNFVLKFAVNKKFSEFKISLPSVPAQSVEVYDLFSKCLTSRSNTNIYQAQPNNKDETTIKEGFDKMISAADSVSMSLGAGL